MKKSTFFLSAISFGMLVLLTQCMNKASNQQTATKNVQLQTHKEAVDTLRADSTAPIKPLKFQKIEGANAAQFWASNDLSKLFVLDYPDNGFYGDDRYRIEFILTEVKRDSLTPSVYHVKGKNRFKKTISEFEGTMKFTALSSFVDPNIDTTEFGDMNFTELLSGTGEFDLKENPKLNTSGAFKGTFAVEFGKLKDGNLDLWFFSDNTPSKGSGYRFDGTWTSFQKPEMAKPVIWARDIFRFGNDILKDFSIGERDVEINEQYRSLGWDNFWEADEWWHAGKKTEVQ